MKQLTCEMCGSTDLIKQDGVFVCQSCGTKYSSEDAKKMMVEGTVDVTGSTVKVDTSDELSNLYQLARRARNENNIENAAKYYDMILVKEPTSWEASFYSVYYQALNCKIYQITSMVNSINNCLDSALSLIHEHNKDNEIEAYMEVANRVMTAVDAFCNASMNSFGKINANRDSADTDSLMKMSDQVVACNNLLLNLGNKLDLLYITLHDEKLKELALSAWKSANRNFFLMLQYLDSNLRNRLRDSVKGLCEPFTTQISKYEPDYQDPITKHIASQTPSGGCYVATAVYGSYDCPQVWTLRRYRDYTLAETWYGRAFIHTYYAISPALVKWFGHTEWFKKMWKGKLDRMVANLNAEGIEDTPYVDQEW